MSSIALNFFRQIGRFSILYVLAAPIYIFATEGETLVKIKYGEF